VIEVPGSPKPAVPGAGAGAAAAPVPLPGPPGGDAIVVLDQQRLLSTNYTDTRKALIDTEFALQQAQRELERLKKLAETQRDPDPNSLTTAENNLGLARRHADRVRREYETQTRLLELQVNAARARLSEAQRDFERVDALRQSGAVSQEEIEKRRSALDVVKSELEYVMTLLELHRQAVEGEQPKK
jgi:multidrug resistance efflux pump